MKFTIEGFSQRKLIEYDLDIIDASILRYFIDFRESGNMITKVIGEKQYCWVKYEGVIEALPILKLNKPDSVYRRLRKMVEAKILECVTVKQGGTFSFYKIGPNYLKIISDENPNVSDINPRQTDNNPIVSDENPNQTDINPEQNIHLLYSSINNSSINIPYIEIKNLWNETCKSFSQIMTLSRKRKDKLKSRFDEIGSIDKFKEIFEKIEASDFLKGDNNKNWTCSFDWIIENDNNYVKVLEGKYDNKTIKKIANKNNKGTFNNYEQREYDFDDLEKKLLGW